MCRDVHADIIRYLNAATVYQHQDFFGRNRISWKKKLSALTTASILCTGLYRLSHWFYCKNWKMTANLIAHGNRLLNKASIHPACRIGGGLYIPHTASIVVQACAGKNLTLYSAATVVATPLIYLFSTELENVPMLGDGVTVGSRANIVGAVSVGTNTTVSFNTNVAKNIPADTTVFSRRITNYTIGFF